MAEVVTASMARSYEAMQRSSVRYDYEKVFWNGTFTLGLLGLGWVAVKLGQTISGAQKVITDATQIIVDPNYVTYKQVYDYVEGVKKLDPLPGGNAALISAITRFRADPEDWAIFKETTLEANPDWVVDASGKPTADPLPAEKVLNFADTIFSKYGAAMPIGAVVLHIVLEYGRVHKLRSEPS
jgi:hypothetical protein